MGLALGFDAINRERSQGTLNRLVSQPIHRDAVINAKFLAGATVILLMIFFVGIMVGALGLVAIGVPPTGEELLRLFSYLLLTAFYTMLWLGISILCSVLCKHAATAALIVIALWIYLTVFASMVASVIANLCYPLDGIEGYYNMLNNYQLELNLQRTSPYYLYSEAATTLLNPDMRFIGFTTTSALSGALAGSDVHGGAGVALVYGFLHRVHAAGNPGLGRRLLASPYGIDAVPMGRRLGMSRAVFARGLSISCGNAFAQTDAPAGKRRRSDLPAPLERRARSWKK